MLADSHPAGETVGLGLWFPYNRRLKKGEHDIRGEEDETKFKGAAGLCHCQAGFEPPAGFEWERRW